MRVAPIAVILMLLAMYSSAGAQALPLTTQDVVRMLLESNRDLTVSRAVPLSSMYSVASLYRPFLPSFYSSGNFTRTTNPSSNVLAGAASLVELTFDYKAGFQQLLDTGTSYSAEFEISRSSSNSIFTVYNPAYNGTLRYRFTQHLLRDFGRQVNSRQIRIARNNEKISELDFELQIIESVSDALQSYWDLVFAAEDAKVKQRSLELASKTLHDNQIQVDIGTMAPLDLVQTEAEVATRYDDLVTAQYGIDQLQNAMKRQISGETDAALSLAQLDLIEPVRRPGAQQFLPLSQAIQFALENRREMKQAGYDAENQDVNVRYAKNQMRPILDVTAGYAHTGLGGPQNIRSSLADGAQLLNVIPGGVGDMFRQLFSYNYPGYSAGFNLQIPLWDRASRADYDRAVNERHLSAARKAATAQRIALEVRNAHTSLEMSEVRVATARKVRELTGRKLEAEQRKFELGTSTVRFVLEEQRNMAQAETNEIQALVNYTKALVIYDRAIGNTLERNNIAFSNQLPAQLTAKREP
jgi:outer membrane protein